MLRMTVEGVGFDHHKQTVVVLKDMENTKLLPIWIGDVYPLTSAPMFRDRPELYCNYRVYAPDGTLLPAEDFLVQRIYDGNPVGYGVGIQPPAVLERFGQERSEADVRAHIAQQLARPQNARYTFVDVEQEVIGATDAQRVGIVRTDRWRVQRLPADAAASR